jgi:hypothetical protein
MVNRLAKKAVRLMRGIKGSGKIKPMVKELSKTIEQIRTADPMVANDLVHLAYRFISGYRSVFFQCGKIIVI